MSEQQIYTATLDPKTRTASAPSSMNGAGSRNHPALAINRTAIGLLRGSRANRSRDGSVAPGNCDASGRASRRRRPTPASSRR